MSNMEPDRKKGQSAIRTDSLGPGYHVTALSNSFISAQLNPAADAAVIVSASHAVDSTKEMVNKLLDQRTPITLGQARELVQQIEASGDVNKGMLGGAKRFDVRDIRETLSNQNWDVIHRVSVFRALADLNALYGVRIGSWGVHLKKPTEFNLAGLDRAFGSSEQVESKRVRLEAGMNVVLLPDVLTKYALTLYHTNQANTEFCFNPEISLGGILMGQRPVTRINPLLDKRGTWEDIKGTFLGRWDPIIQSQIEGQDCTAHVERYGRRLRSKGVKISNAGSDSFEISFCVF